MSERYILSAQNALLGGGLETAHDVCLIIADGQIEKILPRAACTPEDYPGFETIRFGPEYTLMPGMIDCHNHLAMDARVPGHLQNMQEGPCEHTLWAVKNLRDDLLAGVTSARCMGDRYYLDVLCRSEISCKRLTGPRLFVSGIGMRSLHGHGYVGVPFTGEEEFRRASRENLAQGVDFLKIFVTSGSPPLQPGPIPCFMTEREIAAVVEEADQVGKSVTAHCIGGLGLTRCVRAGVRVIDHLYAVGESELALLADHHTWIDLTSGIFLDPSREPMLTDRDAEKTRLLRERVRTHLTRIFEYDLNYTLGTDAYHTYLWKEVGYAIELGAKPRSALQAVTSRAAEMLQQEDFIGSIGTGLQADLIAVGGDPLEDFTALARVDWVMQAGQVFQDCRADRNL